MTELTVATVASQKARSRRASICGISSRSGGIGKNELSVNATAASSQTAPGFCAWSRSQVFIAERSMIPQKIREAEGRPDGSKRDRTLSAHPA